MRGWKEDDYLPGATIPLGGTARWNKTGSWRALTLPYFDRRLCIDCLLCWVTCPDICIVMKDDEIQGIDLDYCKGCGICASVCPQGAITMVNKNES